MLKIKKDNVELVVTAGAYDNLYKAMGYEVVSGGKPETKVAAPVKEAAPEVKVDEEPTKSEKPTFTKNTDKKSDKVEK